MSFFPSSALLVGHVTRYAPASRLEYEKKTLLIFVQLILFPFLNQI